MLEQHGPILCPPEMVRICVSLFPSASRNALWEGLESPSLSLVVLRFADRKNQVVELEVLRMSML